MKPKPSDPFDATSFDLAGWGIAALARFRDAWEDGDDFEAGRQLDAAEDALRAIRLLEAKPERPRGKPIIAAARRQT